MKSIEVPNIYVLQCRLADGDQKALKVLYDHYGKKLLLFSLAIVHSHETAEEVVEDVFIGVWKHRHRIRDIENFTWYLYIATKNTSCSYLRKNGRKKIFNIDEVSVPYLKLELNPEDIAITHETIQRIHFAINNLPPKCRQIFKMVKEDGLKYREVAELLEVNIKTVENQMGIALKKIYTSLNLPLKSDQRISEK